MDSYAGAAYCDMPQIQEWDCLVCKMCTTCSGFKLLGYFLNDTTQAFGYVGSNPNTKYIIVSLRGTSSTAEFLFPV